MARWRIYLEVDEKRPRLATEELGLAIKMNRIDCLSTA
jgi:hypothetical protein